MGKHNLANKKTTRKTNAKTMTMTNTFREYLQRGIFLSHLENTQKWQSRRSSESDIYHYEFRPFQTKLNAYWYIIITDCPVNGKLSFEMTCFIFGTQTLIYQSTMNGVVGGVLGRYASLKFQYFFWNLFCIMYDKSVIHFWFFRNKFLDYHKL